MIDAGLRRYEGRVAVTTLHGLRGVGKTTLAAAYAERHQADYRAIWWIHAQKESTMRADIFGLGVQLGWVGKDEKEEAAFAKVRERLRREGEGLLLIYDNAIDVESLRPYLPTGGKARILVTSNAQTWREIATTVELRLWPPNIGADYLVARTGREQERRDAEALSNALDGLPLAHEQAAAYCERLGLPLAEYVRRLEATPTKLLDAERDAPVGYHDRLTVRKTFGLAIEEATRRHPAAEPLIVHAALLAPEPIPLFLFSDGREALGEPLVSLLAEDGLDEAVAALRDFALVDRQPIADERDPTFPPTDTIRLHRLVKTVAANRPDEATAATIKRSLIAAARAVYPYESYNTPKNWPRARRLNELVSALLGEDEPASGSEIDVAWLTNALADYRHAVLGAYAKARPLFERALAIREKALGPEHPDTAQSLNNLAISLQYRGDSSAPKRSVSALWRSVRRRLVRIIRTLR